MSEEELPKEGDENEEVYEPASLLKRFLNYIVDYTIITVLTLFYMDLNGMEIESYSQEDMYSTFSVYVLFALLPYYIIGEGIFGRTIGKVLTNTYLVDADGYKPSFFKIVIRTLCRLIPFEAVTFLIPGINGWHDSISGTRVIEEVKR